MPDLTLTEDVCVLHGDSLHRLPTLPENSVDAIITDPPYELTGKTGTGGFMGHAWDATGIAYNINLWKECLRVLKPGGHLAAFGAPRTIHRVTCAIEDAGFEIRDQISWQYGSGMPKSMNVGKKSGNPAHQGLGTALKPAHEPIVIARKPLTGTVVANVNEYGTGAMNIDAARVKHRNAADLAESEKKNQHAKFGTKPGGNKVYGDYSMVEVKDYNGSSGRWPANLILTHSVDCRQEGSQTETVTINTFDDGAKPFGGGAGQKYTSRQETVTTATWVCVEDCPVAALDQQSGVTTSGAAGKKGSSGFAGGYDGEYSVPYGDTGGASRFFQQTAWEPEWDVPFRYVSKPNAKERNAGLDGDNPHSTVKPIALMAYLIRLLCPPGGIVLDPFTGSGTTGVAAIREGRGFIGVEMTDEYVPVIEARLRHALAGTTPTVQEQLDLFGADL